MNEDGFDWFFAYVFPFFFIGMWLAVTALLGAFAGWFELQRIFPDLDERHLTRLRARSGTLGKGSMWNPWGAVSYGGCLRMDVCPSGLRLAVWKIFAPFQKPIFIPWPQIRVEETKVLWLRFYRLHFGQTGSILTIWRGTFRRIAADSKMTGNFATFNDWASEADRKAFDR